MLYLYDSVQKVKLEFEPIINDGKVRVYVCGPTVYDNAHLGHARSAISFDILHRVLKANGFEVIMSKNFTDIDDKIIKKLDNSTQTLQELTQYYIDDYLRDMNLLNILPNSIEPKATQNIDIMVDMIEKLLSKDIAYIIDDGVYFDTSKDNKYGQLSHKIADETQSRIGINQQKRNGADFALWKFNDDISYDAPFGKGRPGWHIECSAMIDRFLAIKDASYSIDIHCGGADLLFPHHENEASQSRCANNQELSKYWLHNGFVTINNEKMSKSLGNSFFIKDIFKLYNAEVVRFYLMSIHYRADFNFANEDLEVSKKRLDKLYRLKKRVYPSSHSKLPNKKFEDSIKDALNDDLNTSKAISLVDKFIQESNDLLDKNPKDKALKKQIISSLRFLEDILGIGYQDPYNYFRFGLSDTLIQEVDELISARDEAKREKNYQLADDIRQKLIDMKISIMDTPNGTVWEKV